MTCTTCGAAVAPEATFCHQCGARVESSGAVIAEADTRYQVNFIFEASALGFFGRGLLLVLSAVFILPLPWTICWYARWFASQVRATGGHTFQFLGTPGNVWKLVAAYVLTMILSNVPSWIDLDETDVTLMLLLGVAVQLIFVAIYWGFAKWAIDHLELDGRRWSFNGSVWGYLGWNLLIFASILTIIGWAWATVGFYNWIAGRIQNAGGKLHFAGTGYQLLWRTLVMLLFCLPIVTIPFAFKWFYDWLVEQVELTPAAEG